MKIAIIGSRGYPYVYSGYETFVKELSERLVKQNIAVTVYCHKNLFQEFPSQVNGINLVYIKTIEKKSLGQFVHSFQSIIHSCFKKYDIILVVNSANGPFGLFTKLFRKKTAINVDGLEWLRPKWKGLGSKYFYFASWLSTKLYDVIINDSFAMADFYKKEFGVDSTVIAYGANIRHSSKPELIKKWDLDKNEYYLIVGRLIPDNNADLIVKEFVKSNTKKKLVIVGDVTYQDEYAAKIKKVEDDRILFTGYVNDQDELAELYHNCFAYFHGHEFGGTNPTMLTAMAYGCAVIALDTQFTREMCNDEKHAIYFTKEFGNLKRIIEEVEKNDSVINSLKAISRNRITENYTWEKITEQYITLFYKMLKQKVKS
jgi:glycosyltransferase involved in cell wall biosynthesis